MQRRYAEWRGDADPALLAEYDAAWRTLSDPASRYEYDQAIGLGGPAPASSGDRWAPADQDWAGQQQPQYSHPQAASRTGTAAQRPPGGANVAFAARHRPRKAASARIRE